MYFMSKESVRFLLNFSENITKLYNHRIVNFLNPYLQTASSWQNAPIAAPNVP